MSGERRPRPLRARVTAMMPVRRRRSKSCLVSRSRIIKNSRYQWECKDKDGVQIVLGQMHLRHTVSCHIQSKLLSSWFPADFPCPLSLHLFADRCIHVLIMLVTTSNTHRYWQPRSNNVLCCTALLHMLSRIYNLPCHGSSPCPTNFSRYNMLDRDRSRPETQPTLPPRTTYPQNAIDNATFSPINISTRPTTHSVPNFVSLWPRPTRNLHRHHFYPIR